MGSYAAVHATVSVLQALHRISAVFAGMLGAVVHVCIACWRHVRTVQDAAPRHATAHGAPAEYSHPPTYQHTATSAQNQASFHSHF